MIVIHIDALLPAAEFAARVVELARMIKSGPPADGVEAILLPGELEHREELRAREHGFEVDEMIWNDLAGIAAEFGLEPVLERVRRPGPQQAS